MVRGILGLVSLVVLVGHLSVPSTARLVAETPTAIAQAEPTLNTPLLIPPGETVYFVRPSFRDQGTLLHRRIVNQSDQPATALDDGRVLTLSVPEGSTLQAEVVYEGLYAQTVPCPTEPQSPHVARCIVFEYRATPTFVRFTTSTVPPAIEQLLLMPGCSNVVLTWPQQTPLDLVARAVSPEGALEAIWKFDAAQERFFAFSPQAHQASDLTLVDRLDAVFICVRMPGMLTRPIL